MEFITILYGNICTGVGRLINVRLFVCLLLDRQSVSYYVDVITCTPPGQELERRCRRIIRTRSVPLEKYLVSAAATSPNDR
jgi:hypothetical protein